MRRVIQWCLSGPWWHGGFLLIFILSPVFITVFLLSLIDGIFILLLLPIFGVAEKLESALGYDFTNYGIANPNTVGYLLILAYLFLIGMLMRGIISSIKSLILSGGNLRTGLVLIGSLCGVIFLTIYVYADDKPLKPFSCYLVFNGPKADNRNECFYEAAVNNKIINLCDNINPVPRQIGSYLDRQQSCRRRVLEITSNERRQEDQEKYREYLEIQN